MDHQNTNITLNEYDCEKEFGEMIKNVLLDFGPIKYLTSGHTTLSSCFISLHP